MLKNSNFVFHQLIQILFVLLIRVVLSSKQVSLFFTESPTNPFLRCVDIERVSKLCHRKGALVCIDGTFATPLNQKALALGADLVVHSATKFIGGHNDVCQYISEPGLVVMLQLLGLILSN